MEAMLEDLELEMNTGIPWQNGYSLETFLKCLAATEYHEMILECKPNNVADGRPLKEAFKTSWGGSFHALFSSSG